MPICTQELRSRYGETASHNKDRVLGRLDEHCRKFIEASPFAVMATHDGAGHMDASPRGGAPGFVEFVDEHTLHLPDRPGNVRLDSMENLCGQQDIGLLFFIPGINETLRVNGQAQILFDESLLDKYSVAQHAALAVIEVSVSEAFIHGGKALIRSRLWDSDLQADNSAFPSLGEIIVDQVDGLGEDEANELLTASSYHNLY